MLENIRKALSKRKALRELRASLNHFAEVENVSDKDLESWVRENITKLGTHEIVSATSIPSYIKVENAISKENYVSDLMQNLVDEYNISEADINLIYEKCDNDPKKMSFVVQMMAITFDSDDNVLANYDNLYNKLRYKLKLL